ncbi:FKBP-type peptidyl-prolyl cis-trans isomerase [Spirosoma rigui]|uniref:FKBP-type peptidyl-prolyl cis-trans isomerase n=1 Tax=Spirosoma rigui TaxID=564064 RepID=UPI0009AFC2A6|nr:FKBP-type peptidyl-prolyl cis-trans isomerase [Spirosoma rigui]
MRKLQLSIFFAVVVSGLTSCMNESADPTSKYYDANDVEIQAYKDQNGGTVTTTGLYYKITTPNTAGKQATVGEELEFRYKATNLKGQFVDSSAATAPVYYPLGIQSVFPGLEQGLSLLREGETATLLIPSYLAYNDQAKTNLPAYSVVRFDVTLNRSRSEEQQIDEYIANNKLTVTEKTASGLRFIRTVTNANGTTPGIGQTLTIKYLGKQLRNASAFDSTGTGTFDALLGQSKYVKGFEEGLSKMKIGEKATIIFPSTLGYGTSGVIQSNRYVITPYAPLRFDLELVSAK